MNHVPMNEDGWVQVEAVAEKCKQCANVVLDSHLIGCVYGNPQFPRAVFCREYEKEN